MGGGKRGAVATAAALGVGIAVVAAHSIAERRRLDAAVSELEARVGALRGALDAERRGESTREAQALLARVSPHAPGAAAAEPASAPAPAKPAEVEPAREASADPHERLAYLTAVLENEAPDRGWAAASAARLQAGLGRIVKNAADLERVECRATLCRARFTNRDRAECESFVERSTNQEPPYFWEGAYLVVRDGPSAADGCGVSLIFARERSELPALE